jgi:hypothetical protein
MTDERLHKMVDGVKVYLTPEEEAEIRAEWAANAEKMKATEYIEKRKSEYPPFTDYLDGIVKGDQAQVQAYIDACLAVKNKYPKV